MHEKNQGFYFNGAHSSTMGLVLQAPMVLSAPEPRIERITIPGRDGTLTRWDGSYNPRTLNGKFFVLSANAAREITDISAWLIGSHKKEKLITDDDGQYYLMAMVSAGAETQLRCGVLAPFSLSFVCDPCRYLIWGDEEVDVFEERTIYNPTAYPAKPIIYMNGSGSVSLEIAGKTITAQIPDGGIYFDAETANAYTGKGSANALVSVSGDITLPGGYTDITVNGDLTALKITPRWWEL